LFGILRHMGLLRRQRGTAAGSRVDKLRGIPVVVPRERQQRQHCWSRMQTVRTLTEVTTQQDRQHGWDIQVFHRSTF